MKLLLEEGKILAGGEIKLGTHLIHYPRMI